MVRRHPLPPQWLFSDERLTVGVVGLAAMLPPGSGIVLRHDSLGPGARWRLLRRLMRVARTRGLTVLLAGTPEIARRWGADGVHLRQHDARRAAQAIRLGLVMTMPVHDAQEARRARRANAGRRRFHFAPQFDALASWGRVARLGSVVAAGALVWNAIHRLGRNDRRTGATA